MDNFKVDVVANGHRALGKAIEIAMMKGGEEIQAYAVSAEHGFVFLTRATATDAVLLPFSLDASGAAEFAQRWLNQQKYPPKPDFDGHCSAGWRVYSGEWGRLGPYADAVFAVQPVWAMYGK